MRASNFNGTKEEYFRNMESIGNKSLLYLEKTLNDRIKNANLFGEVESFLRKRKKAIVRPWIVQNSWRYFSQKPKGDIWVSLAAVAELENLSNYQSNTVYDGKYEKKHLSKREETAQIISSFVTRNIVDDILFEEYDSKLASSLSAIFRKIDQYNQLGQYKEIDKLYYFSHFNFEKLPDYLEEYLKKTIYYGAAWMVGLILAGNVLASNGFIERTSDLTYLANFGALSGTAINLINDISDYALFLGEENKFRMHYKNPEDQFKDIENNRILLPFYYACHQARSKDEREFFKLKNTIGKKLSIEDKMMVLELIGKYDGLSFAYTIARIINNEGKRRVIKKVSNQTCSEIKSFKTFASITENNKFLKYYRKKGLIKKLRQLDIKTKRAINKEIFNEKSTLEDVIEDFFKLV